MTRKEKALRILAVQQQRQRIEDARLAQLQSRFDSLEAEQKDIIAALNADDAFEGAFVDTMARRLRPLSEASKRAAVAKDAQSQRVLERTRQAKCAERLAKAVSDAEDKLDQDRQLREAIEIHLTAKDASLP